MLALKAMGADKIRCEVRAFDDELDEWETLIECNKQREKTRIQKANEINKLSKIKAERAIRKQKEAGQFGNLGGQPAQKRNLYPSAEFSGRVESSVSTFHHSEPSPTTALENIATIKVVSNGGVTDETKPFTRAELAAQINQLHDIKAMKAAKQLAESQLNMLYKVKQKRCGHLVH